MKLQTVILFLLIPTLFACEPALKAVSISVQITDEQSNPVKEAEAVAGFPHFYGAGAPYKGEAVTVLTGKDGRAKLSGRTSGSVSFGARKTGYYDTSGGRIELSDLHSNGEGVEDLKLLILRKIDNPIPLFARPFNYAKLPQLNKPCGFDLEVGDWVAPWGRGAKSDIIFEIKGTFQSYREHELSLEVSFPNMGDGMLEFPGSRNLGSQLRSAHLAPTGGYQPRLALHRKALYNQKSSQWLNDSKPGSNYYLRVRTILNKEGEVVSANYGKIYGNFEFLDFIKVEAMYFNPKPNDRNLEFNPRKNLTKSADSSDYVSMP